MIKRDNKGEFKLSKRRVFKEGINS